MLVVDPYVTVRNFFQFDHQLTISICNSFLYVFTVVSAYICQTDLRGVRQLRYFYDNDTYRDVYEENDQQGRLQQEYHISYVLIILL
jgi:hypothetical protein